MGNKLTKKHYIFAIIYSAIFLLSGFLGETAGFIAMFITIPFLPIAWIGGTALVDILNTKDAMPFGLYFSILIQVLLVLKFSPKRKLFKWLE